MIFIHDVLKGSKTLGKGWINKAKGLNLIVVRFFVARFRWPALCFPVFFGFKR